MLESSIDIEVRYAETDQMGIVYHANYLVWFEVARIRLLADAGLHYTEIEADGLRIPVLAAHLEYHQPVVFGETVRVTARVSERPRVRFGVDYQVAVAETTRASGYTVHAFMTSQNRPTRPPPAFMALFSG